MGDAKFFGKQIALLDKELETLKAKGKENDRAAEDKYKALSSSADDKYFVLQNETTEKYNALRRKAASDLAVAEQRSDKARDAMQEMAENIQSAAKDAPAMLLAAKASLDGKEARIKELEASVAAMAASESM